MCEHVCVRAHARAGAEVRWDDAQGQPYPKIRVFLLEISLPALRYLTGGQVLRGWDRAARGQRLSSVEGRSHRGHDHLPPHKKLHPILSHTRRHPPVTASQPHAVQVPHLAPPPRLRRVTPPRFSRTVWPDARSSPRSAVTQRLPFPHPRAGTDAPGPHCSPGTPNRFHSDAR